MEPGLMRMIVARLASLPVGVFFDRAPVKTARPYLIFSGENPQKLYEGVGGGMRSIDVVVVVVGDAAEGLESRIQPVTTRAAGLLANHAPVIEGAKVMRAELADAPTYGQDDDGDGDVWVGRFMVRYQLQTEG